MSNHSGALPTWLTSDYLEKMLEEFFEDDSLRLIHTKIEPASFVGDNYGSEVFRVEVEYNRKRKRESRSIIAKIIPNNDLSKGLNKGFDMFQVEVTMMSKTLPLLHKELCAKGIRERFFPYLYKRDDSNRTIIMEDLKPEGYVMVDRKKSLDLDHILLATKALARLHASSYLYLKKDPSHKENYLDYFLKKRGDDMMEKIVNGLFNYLIKSLDLWPIGEEDKKIMKSFEGKLQDLITGNYEVEESNFNVLIHDDCSTRNFMFKYANEKVECCKLIDFQTCNYNSFGMDVNYLLFSSAQEHVILMHLEDVFKTYYEAFTGVSGKINHFTINTVRSEFLKKLSFGFLIAITFRPVLLAETPCDMDAFVQGRESKSNLEMLRNNKFISEMANLLPMLKKYGVFNCRNINIT